MALIIVIDDEEENRRLAHLILERHGHKVIEEAEAQAGIAAARHHQPDLILMDINMPLLDGWTATQVLRADPALAHVPIIAWTALDIGGEAGALAAGYDGFMSKPFTLAQFESKVAAILAAGPRRPAQHEAATAEAAPLARPPANALSLSCSQVLVLSNDKSLRQELGQHLADEGCYSLVELADLANALETIHAQTPDLVLLDLTLGEPGLGLLQQLKADAKLEAVQVIAVAGLDAGEPGWVQAMQAGADDSVLRPINWDELAARMLNRLHVKLLADRLRHRQANLESLYQASQVLGASLDPTTVLNLVLEQSAATVEATQGRLYLIGDHCQPVRQLCTANTPSVSLSTLQAMFERAGDRWACKLLKPMVVENTPQTPHALRVEGDGRTHSSLAVPLVGREGVMGLLWLDHDEGRHFTHEHVAWLTALAAQASVALDNARLFESVRVERKKLSAILDSSADAIVVVDNSMHIALINAAAGQVLGLRANAIGHSISEQLRNNPLSGLFDFAELRQETVNLEVSIGDGVYHATVKPVPGVGYVAALHDIRWLKEFERIEIERERQETERVRREFARHVSLPVAELLLKRGESLSTLRKCPAAILFSDLRNYTALTERIGMEAVVEYVLKRYITVMTDMIYAQEGTINKMLGDGIMAVFGVPIPQSDAPQRALRTALAMQRALSMLRDGWQRDLGQDISMGIGLAWGEVVAGDIGGSSQRVDYTVVGDAVNLASRLGQIAAPGEVLLSDTLAQEVDSDSQEWRLEELPPVTVKGKEQPQRVYRASSLWQSRAG